MNRTRRIYIIIFVLVCALFIFDKKVFNKELFISPYIPWWNDVRGSYVIWENHIQHLHNQLSMRAIVLREVQGLTDFNISDFERVNRIRKWVYELSTWGIKPVSYEQRNLINWSTSLKMYDVFKKSKQAYDCGVYTVFLVKIYQLFGLESYVYDMGKEQQDYHSIVLVWINEWGKRKLIIEDPSYNLTYVDTKNEPMDFFELLRHIKEKNEKKVVIRQDASKGHKALCFPDDLCDITGKRVEWKSTDGAVVYRNHFDMQKIKKSTPSFLYCRNLGVTEENNSIPPTIKLAKASALKKKLRSIIEVAPTVR